MEKTTSIKNPLIHSLYWGNRQGEEVHRQRAQFQPPKLPYSYSTLALLYEPEHLKNHFFNFHWKGFEDFLDLINDTRAEKMGMQQIFAHQDEFDDQLIENACNVFNHQLYWDNLSPYGGEVSKQLELAINECFGSVFKLKLDLIDLGVSHKSNGWLWLIINEKQELQLLTTKHYQNPILKNAPVPGTPILAIDLWDHAYYPKFSHKDDYLKTVWMLINWTEVSNRYRYAF